MKTALDLIKEFEGFRTKPYTCPAGKWTVGYGSTFWNGIAVDEHYPASVTEEEAEKEAYKSLEKIREVLIGKNINFLHVSEGEQQATLDLAYNVGVGAVIRSQFWRKMMAGDPKGAAAELDDWNKATVNGKKVVLEGLTKRRKAEKELFLSVVPA